MNLIHVICVCLTGLIHLANEVCDSVGSFSANTNHVLFIEDINIEQKKVKVPYLYRSGAMQT